VRAREVLELRSEEATIAQDAVDEQNRRSGTALTRSLLLDSQPHTVPH